VNNSASRKYTAPLRDTPATLTVIPAAVIQEQGAASLRDVLRNTPGITFQAGEGGGGLPGDQNFTMRGFSARNSLFIDGVRDSGAYTRDAFNLDQVEVAKGPTSAIGGRSTSAGAINQVSKTPKSEAFQDFTLGLGTDQYKRTTADINQPIGDGHSLRLNAMYYDTDVADRDVVKNERWGVAPSFALGLDGPTRLTLSYLYLEEDNVPDYGLPWGSYTQNGITYPTGAFNANPPVDQSIFYGLKDYDFEDIESQVGTVQFEHDFNDAIDLQNITRYLDTDRDSAITAPRPPNRQLQRRTMGFENLTNQTNLGLKFSTGSFAHTVTTGLELSHEVTDSANSSQTTNQPQLTNFWSPNPNDRPLGPMPANTGNPSESTVDTIGVYAFDTIALTKQWSLSGGLRWDQTDVDYDLTTLTTGVTSTLKSDDSLVSWQAGLVYKPLEIASVYFGTSTSFDPTVDAGTTGAGLSDAATSINNINLDPEKSKNYEVGTKWELSGGRLLLTGALFRTEKTNARTRTTSNDPYILTGKQVVDGVEVSASGSIGEHLSVFGGYAFLDSAIDKTANPIEQDEVLLLTPKHSFNAWTTYQLGSLTLGAGTQFLDNVTRSRTATGDVVLPSYWLFDFMVSYRLSNRLTVRLNTTNLGDKDYVDRVGGGHYIPGAGRSGWLTAAFTF
jgi:catecholate siderophore receptor